mmetsp:Transcript_18563/g.48881  ORF Transcript_18563/g.48881 Transcript_18563/m.48881 type:complete len:247 (-) Transcript_18563:906-1646(-)
MGRDRQLQEDGRGEPSRAKGGQAEQRGRQRGRLHGRCADGMRSGHDSVAGVGQRQPVRCAVGRAAAGGEPRGGGDACAAGAAHPPRLALVHSAQDAHRLAPRRRPLRGAQGAAGGPPTLPRRPAAPRPKGRDASGGRGGGPPPAEARVDAVALGGREAGRRGGHRGFAAAAHTAGSAGGGGGRAGAHQGRAGRDDGGRAQGHAARAAAAWSHLRGWRHPEQGARRVRGVDVRRAAGDRAHVLGPAQ